MSKAQLIEEEIARLMKEEGRSREDILLDALDALSERQREQRLQEGIAAWQAGDTLSAEDLIALTDAAIEDADRT